MLRRFLFEFLFFHMSPIVRRGRTRPLREPDLLELPTELEPHPGAEHAARLARARGPVGFLLALYASERQRMGRAFLYATLHAACTLGSAALVHAFLSSLADAAGRPGVPVATLLLGLAFALTGLGVLLFPQHAFYNTFLAYLRIVGKLNVALYDHTLRLPSDVRRKRGVGDIVNLMSADSEAIGDSANMVPELYANVIVIVGAFAMLFWLLGPAALAAVSCFLVLVPAQKWLAGRFVTLDTRLMEARDARVSKIAQLLRGIRVVKFFGWRKGSFNETDALRAVEIGHRRKLVWAEGASTFVFLLTSAAVAVATFYVHIRLGGTLTAPVAFAAMSLFLSLEEPLSELSFVLANLVSAKVSAGRVKEFLEEATLRANENVSFVPRAVLSDTPFASVGSVGSVGSVSTAESQAPSVRFDGVSVRFENAPRASLDDVSFEIAPGEAVAVVGDVGAGKSTLLHALLGEVALQRGCVHVASGLRGLRVGYVPQEAFVLNADVRENVLLGEPSVRFEDAVSASALTHDIGLLPAGVATEIGEQGVNLSGGQKQRLSLARAAAMDPNLVLLDDPLSAVDETTERHLRDALLFGLWKGATRVVTTHRHSSLPRFDRVVFLRAGRVVAQGPFAELLARSDEFRAFVSASARAGKEASRHADEPVSSESAARASGPSGAPVAAATAAAPASGDQAAGLASGRVTDDEDARSGAVSGNVYARYFRALGGGGRRAVGNLGALAGITLLAFVLPFVQRAWLSAWTESPVAAVGAEATEAGPFLIRVLAAFVSPDAERNLGVFLAIGIVGFTSVFLERVAWLRAGLTGGKLIHEAALGGVLRSPLSFFDSNPQGRILNRFSRDMDAVDRHLPWAVSNTVRSAANVVATLVVVVTLFPLLLVVALPVGLVFLKMQADYRASARELKRMDARARSPVFAHFKETISGLVEIRAHGKQGVFASRFHDRVRAAIRVTYNGMSLNRWFAVRIPLVTFAVSIAIVTFLSLAAWKGTAGPGVAGLVLTYASLLWGSLSWGVRAFAEMESRMTGVERLFEYEDETPEPDTTMAPALPDEAPWPTRGEIVFDGVHVSYGEGRPDILRGIDLVIPAGAKVGFVGRTGAGKSTLFQALFRFLETSRGRISIDGVPLGAVPLDRLRGSLAIIPQDPVLFAGSLRGNIDRFSRHDDAALWMALEAAHLKETVKSLPGGLAFELSENGSNLSQGQRQMICLARALLCGARIILLDEATASVDPRTDALMQKTFRERGAGATVLVIAHRLETLADCDVVVELRDGRVASVTGPRAAASRRVDGMPEWPSAVLPAGLAAPGAWASPEAGHRRFLGQASASQAPEST